MDRTLKDILSKYGAAFAVYDRSVERFALDVASEAGLGPASLLAVDGGESFKSIDSVLEVCRFLLDRGADRRSIVLAIGGGTISDTVGFAAASTREVSATPTSPPRFLRWSTPR